MNMIYIIKRKGVDVKSMTKEKVRFTYRMTPKLFEAISDKANEKGITINAEITNLLWRHYFGKKGTMER